MGLKTDGPGMDMKNYQQTIVEETWRGLLPTVNELAAE